MERKEGNKKREKEKIISFAIYSSIGISSMRCMDVY